ncbi:hypothetical protein [Bradyrhizobium sp. CW1]|uniref:hypothetical protein n=1 Tax=Bradyrhizobium sp. CW1 TaxID=2782686 RepID=UPI001FFE92A4|nr:hypothetical protein [Bradyrhizobium sp. CW1]UPJ26489.1 hypothetical protein IVB54_33165 [Bradyrhizobium sp. CW1]
MVVTWKSLVAAIEQNPELKDKLPELPVLDEGEQKEKAEIKRLFQFIGMYVVVFQDVESKLDQIIQLAIGLDRRHVSHGIIALLSNSQKIDLVQSIVHSSAIADGSPAQEAWVTSFDEVMQRLRAEATRRNKIVHSLYIFDFMKIGHSPVRSKWTRRKTGASFDQEHVDAAYIDRATSDVAGLSFDVGMVLVQLRNWYEKLGRSFVASEKEAAEE